MTGNVFKIQKYSIHDGPGIRTSVFLKGCPLNCWWCHNPESIRPQKQLVCHGEKCLDCGRCISTCRRGALVPSAYGMAVDTGKCVVCGNCAEACPGRALEIIGREMAVEEVMAAISKDIIFYDESGGGVTFTGGEPTMQFEFLYELLENCAAKGIHTAVDTCGYTNWERFGKLSPLTGVFLYDLKMMDEIRHKKYTGVSNRLILENLQKLSKVHSNIHVRIPVIPGINDDMENISESCNFLSELNIRKVNILPYHSIATGKYERFGMEYRLKDTKPPEEEKLQEILAVFKKAGIDITL